MALPKAVLGQIMSNFYDTFITQPPESLQAHWMHLQLLSHSSKFLIWDEAVTAPLVTDISPCFLPDADNA